MPGRLVAVLLLLAYASSLNGAQDTTMQPGSPTLTETTQWLESHLVGVLHTSRTTAVTYKLKKGQLPKETDRQTSNTHESVSVASFDGCSLMIGQLTKGDDYTVVTMSTVPMDQLTRATLKTDKYNAVKTQTGQDLNEVTIVPSSAVVLTLEASSNAITWKRKSSGNVPLDVDAMPYEGKSTSLSINSDDEAMPPRLANAFNYAVKLCHTNVKPEPF